MGAHLVVHSATKLMDGQGRVLGGITVGDADLIQKIYLFSDLQDLLISV
jgi:O-succinylhomoserine sulfhydrylase